VFRELIPIHCPVPCYGPLSIAITYSGVILSASASHLHVACDGPRQCLRHRLKVPLERAEPACYLVTYVTSIDALILYGPVLSSPDYVVGSGADTRVLLGALLEVILALAIVGTAVTLFPVVQRQNEGVARRPPASAAVLPLAFQNPHDRNDRVPISCRRRHTEQFVDLAKIADRFHVTTVHSEDESVLRRDNSQEPLPLRRKCDWNRRLDAAGFRQDAHESNKVRA
jgi:hypothetical protein